eukprot:TRINITY_DN5658_c0_g1_i6.p1 TRINITY_DN5658_c0_g1~~TRINITY_DN5658_c0_g1_i6.p1  ORF type:complete len:831 (-),score=269.41 TRINITY_DN5658_c0_g1_i6:116-2608(-)
MAGKVSVNGGRIRKVTITEIEDEKEWNWTDPGTLEESKKDIIIENTTDEIFDELDNVVQDWKKKLEFVVADGLKKIKRSTKEKKTMMKYLPGEGTVKGSKAIEKAKSQILAEWKDDINKAIDATHTKLNDLGNEKLKETTKATMFLTPEGEKTEPECTNDCKTVDTCLNLKTLMAELDVLYQRYNDSSVGLTKVPIYNVQNVGNEIPKTRNMTFPWWKPVCTLAGMVDFPKHLAVTGSGNEKDYTSLLKDFIADQKSRKSIIQDWNKMEENKKKAKASLIKKEIKTARRGRNSVQKMKDRREIKKCRQFLLKEIEKEGEKHYYVVKKEVEEPSNMTAVEDIFADWNSNFARIKRPRTIKPRTRKISHRAERKEMVKEAKKVEEVMQGPLTYSQMVRKNLKIPKEQPSVEEIYGTWIKCIDKMYKTPKNTNGADDIEVFKCWNFIFGSNEVKPAAICPPPITAFECGQPTVPRINSKVQRNAESPKFPKKEMKSPSTKASKKESIEKLSEKLLYEGYPLKKSEKVEKVLDMAEKKKEKVSKAVIEKKPTEAKSATTEKKSEKLESKLPEKSSPVTVEKEVEHPIVLRNKMQVVPFVEKKSEKESMEELFKKMKIEMPKDVVPVAKDFKPSAHSQRCLAPEVIVQPFIGPINKPNLPKEVTTQAFIGPINKSDLPRSKIITTKDSPMPKPIWSSLIKEKVDESGRGEVKKYKTEEIFDQWRHIFVLTNKQALKPKMKEAVLKQDIYFMEWLRNFDEQIVLTEKRERSSKSVSEEKSPKPSKKAAKMQLRIQDIEDDVTEMKDNRRQDFLKATMIRDKKRTEASRNSLGKRVK